MPEAKEKERKESFFYMLYKNLLSILALTAVGSVAVIYLLKETEKHLIKKIGE